MIALLDANLFVPTWIIDPLLSLAEAGLCEPAWSARVMDEARLAIMEVRHVPDVRAPAVFLTRSAGPFRWPWRRIGSGLNWT